MFIFAEQTFKQKNMTQLKCIECGQIFDGNLEDCPNCGCPASECEPLDNKSSETNETTNNATPRQEASKETGNDQGEKTYEQPSRGIPLNSTDVRDCYSTAGYYRPWWNIMQPWYVSNDDPKEQDRFDGLNEGLLLANLSFRVFLWWTLFFWIAMFCFMTIILIPLGIYVIIKCFPWALSRYWAKMHRLWRRINQRYWISMEHAKKTNKIDEIY